MVDTPPGLSVEEAVRRYRAKSEVLYAEPDYIQQALATPSDPRWPEQWDLVKIAAPQAWDTQTDAGDVIVAVIDTGIDFTHPDLQANLWSSPVDGSHGFDCVTRAAGGQDDHGHGTHVAGTIGAVANNGIGIAGINWNVKVMAFKFLNSWGSGFISDAITCFDKVRELKQSGLNIRLTNNSWGGGGFSQALKDAMAGAEAVGVVHVCAAGNSNQNADAAPMYPAAYDNRGIISVLASTASDTRAGFSNYGLASVDLGAPGEFTLSTVPTGTCSLCDPSGYRNLSGTSMASPHVAGVLAALFHQNPSLSAYEARDVVLDLASYDPFPASDTSNALQTTTGGRLNFYKALTNPLLFSPKLNGFPTVSATPDVTVPSGGTVTLSASASDPDGDLPRSAWTTIPQFNSAWFLGFMLWKGRHFPDSPNGTFSFQAPSLARVATMGYVAATADGRGGSSLAARQTSVTVLPSPAPGLPPSAKLSVTPLSGPIGTKVTWTLSEYWDPETVESIWWASSFANRLHDRTVGCCLSASARTTLSMTMNETGVFRFNANVADPELNVTSLDSVVVRIGGATGEPPIARASVDQLSGPVPLTVTIDASMSSDVDGTITNWFTYSDGVWFRDRFRRTSQVTYTYTIPGVYWIWVGVIDNSGYTDSVDHLYVTATSTPTVDSAPPTVTITSPLNGALVARRSTVTITASASDNVGVGRVDFYVNGTLACADNTAPYSCNWKVLGAPQKTYQLQAKASDAAGNVGSSPLVTVASK